MTDRYYILRYRRQDSWRPYITERVFSTREAAVELVDRLTQESALAPLDDIELITCQVLERVTL